MTGSATALSVPRPSWPDGPRHGVVRVLAVEDDRADRRADALPSTRSAASRRARGEQRVNVASVPPEVNVPPACGPSPARSHIHRTTRVSTTVPTGDISHTAADWLSAAMSGSVQTAAGSGAETWWPIDARVAEVVRVGDDVAAQALEDLLERPPGARQRLVEARARARRDRARVETRPSPARVSAK